MPAVSKELFDRIMKDKSCHDFLHPWSASCTRGLAYILYCSVKGSFKFSVALNMLQLLSKGKNITKNHVKFNLDQTVRMTTFGAGIASIFLITACSLRKLLGRYNFYVSLFVPGLLSGTSIFVMRNAKRHFIISAFSGAVLETLLKHYTPLNGRHDFLKIETLLFMTVNGFFLYLLKLWKTNKIDQNMPEIWFYSPAPAKRTDEKPKHKYHACDHLHSCFRSILKESSNYFWFGTILEILKITLSNIKTITKNPKLIVKFILKKSTLRLAAFAATYVFLYKVTNCLLCRTSGKDSTVNGLVSGFVSGLSYYIYPNLSLSLTAFINLIHIAWKYSNADSKFAAVPVSELIFMIVCGLLFHCRIVVAPENQSKFFLNMLSLTTIGCSDRMYEKFASCI